MQLQGRVPIVISGPPAPRHDIFWFLVLVGGMTLIGAFVAYLVVLARTRPATIVFSDPPNPQDNYD